MASLNFILQGKGGVGKSMIASFLAQHYRQNGITPLCFDTDPVNPTFSNYQALGVAHVGIMEGDNINTRHFDGLIEQLLGLDEDEHVVIDNGAASFVPLCAYLVETDVVTLLQEHGHAVRLHTVITGGQGYQDTVTGMAALINHFPDVPIVIWKNEYFGNVQTNGKAIEDTKFLSAQKQRIAGIVTLPAVKRETFGRDLEALFRRHKTFEEGVADPEFSIMTRQRLKMFWKTVGTEIQAGGL